MPSRELNYFLSSVEKGELVKRLQKVMDMWESRISYDVF